MTRKHYQLIADAVKEAILTEIARKDERKEVEAILDFLNSNFLPNLIDKFCQDNDNFDAFKFVDAIGLVKN